MIFRVAMENGPQTLGLKRSFGFGDRLGSATPGHIEAARGFDFKPVFAQQSIREMTRTARNPERVLETAREAVHKENWEGAWGADADHLSAKEDVERTARAGFTMFTIDPSEHVIDGAASMDEDALHAACRKICHGTGYSIERLMSLYLDKSWDIGEGRPIEFPDRLSLARAFVKYGGALVHAARMHDWITEACGERPFEIELSVDETSSPTSPAEHLLIGLELKRLGVSLVSLAPRFPGAFEKGVDYRGDPAEFEADYRKQIAVARFCGPYKISIHSGSDKFRIYPIIGRLSGQLLHVKTAGTSYLEALRVACRTDPALFREISKFSRGRYESERATYHVSADLREIPANVADRDLENTWLDRDPGRQVLHVAYGSVLTAGKRKNGARFREAILENLARHEALHRECLNRHLGKHLRLLSSG